MNVAIQFEARLVATDARGRTRVLRFGSDQRVIVDIGVKGDPSNGRHAVGSPELDAVTQGFAQAAERAGVVVSGRVRAQVPLVFLGAEDGAPAGAGPMAPGVSFRESGWPPGAGRWARDPDDPTVVVVSCPACGDRISATRPGAKFGPDGRVSLPLLCPCGAPPTPVLLAGWPGAGGAI